MQQLITWRKFAVFLLFLHLWRVRVYDHGVWYILISDGVALAFIMFPKEIDDLTFGQWTPGEGIPAKIDAHTPPFLIAAFGWFMLLAITAMLFFTDWLKMPARS